MKTAKLIKKNIYELRPPIQYRDARGHRRKASFVVAAKVPAAMFPCDYSGTWLDWPAVIEATDKTPQEMIELLGYVIVENNNIYPYSPMKSMGNFADNIDRGR